MSTGREMDKYVVLIYSGLLLSYKKNETVPLQQHEWTQRASHSARGSQTEEGGYHRCCSYVQSIKIIQIDLPIKQNRLTDLENKLTTSKGERCGGGISWEVEIDIYTLLYI